MAALKLFMLTAVSGSICLKFKAESRVWGFAISRHGDRFTLHRLAAEGFHVLGGTAFLQPAPRHSSAANATIDILMVTKAW